MPAALSPQQGRVTTPSAEGGAGPAPEATLQRHIPRRPNLIIDVGMHVGQDTAFYLSKGFDVVAVEANPELVEAARQRFAEQLAAGRLRIIGAAIAEAAGTQQLAVADDRTIWSSLSEGFVARNQQEQGTKYRYVDVPAIPFEEILAETGMPHYLKIDIEGFDMLCVRALHGFDSRPDFISIESGVAASGSGPHAAFDELAELWSLGYRRFSYVDQSANPQRRPPSPPREGTYVEWEFDIDGSGLFGEELPGRWQSPEPALLRAQLLRAQHQLIGLGGSLSRTPLAKAVRRARRLASGRPAPWYDLHARLS